jgi:hypothetical protein
LTPPDQNSASAPGDTKNEKGQEDEEEEENKNLSLPKTKALYFLKLAWLNADPTLTTSIYLFILLFFIVFLVPYPHKN